MTDCATSFHLTFPSRYTYHIVSETAISTGKVHCIPTDKTFDQVLNQANTIAIGNITDEVNESSSLRLPASILNCGPVPNTTQQVKCTINGNARIFGVPTEFRAHREIHQLTCARVRRATDTLDSSGRRAGKSRRNGARR